jgi:hypothetical protein
MAMYNTRHYHWPPGDLPNKCRWRLQYDNRKSYGHIRIYIVVFGHRATASRMTGNLRDERS